MDIYKKQWEEETKHFFKGIKNGNYLVLDDCIAVRYGGYENDPRYICYEFGETRLRDDHFCVQHSPQLSTRQLRDIVTFCERHGIDVTQWEIYYELWAHD